MPKVSGSNLVSEKSLFFVGKHLYQKALGSKLALSLRKAIRLKEN